MHVCIIESAKLEEMKNELSEKEAQEEKNREESMKWMKLTGIQDRKLSKMLLNPSGTPDTSKLTPRKPSTASSLSKGAVSFGSRSLVPFA
jgi:hypothetical protein